jgi:hypothetical protein
MVQDCLVGDFSRQTHVLGRQPVRRGAHQRAAPMGRRSGDMRNSVCGGPDQKIRHDPSVLDTTSDAPVRRARRKIRRPP